MRVDGSRRVKPTPAIVDSIVVDNAQAVDVGTINKSGTQSRKQLDAKTVGDVRSDIRDGNPVDPIVLFFDGNDHWIGDGYHRLEAHLKEKRDIINARIRRGSKEEALRFNIESNASADQTRWTNNDKRNAVTMLLQSLGINEVPRKLADEIATLAECHSALVYKVAAELKAVKDQAARPTSQTDAPLQPTVSQAVTTKCIGNDTGDGNEDGEQSVPSKTEPPKKGLSIAPKGRRSVEKVERDEQVAAMAKEGLSQNEIAERLGVARTTVTKSLNRQKLTPETANPLVKVLERAQLAASEWESIVALFSGGQGAASQWPTASREQKKEVIGHIKEAIKFQTDFINRLNKEAKG